MLEFFNSCACRGSRPQHLSSLAHIPRPRLTSHMLQERSAPRCIVAPRGFGKTGLAFDYANTVFNLEHTFWIDASNPNFIRDLDKVDIKRSLDTLEPEPYLAVFEDVPHMGVHRSQLFRKEVCCMLDAGNEVLITCEPSCDSFEGLPDCVVLHAGDLLLDKSECDTATVARDASKVSFDAGGGLREQLESRIPAVAWGSLQSKSELLSGFVSEGAPAEARLLMFLLLVFGGGRLSHVSHFLPCLDLHVRSFALNYPHMGIDVRKDSFDAGMYTVEEITDVFYGHSERLTEASLFDSFECLMERVCDTLVARGEAQRACELMFSMLSIEACKRWLLKSSKRFMRSLQICAPTNLYRTLMDNRYFANYKLELDQALRLALLGSIEEAALSLRQLAHNLRCPTRVRAQAAVLLLLNDFDKVNKDQLSYARAAVLSFKSEQAFAANKKVVLRSAEGYVNLDEMLLIIEVANVYRTKPNAACKQLLRAARETREGRVSDVLYLLIAFSLRSNNALGKEGKRLAQWTFEQLNVSLGKKRRNEKSRDLNPAWACAAKTLLRMHDNVISEADKKILHDFEDSYDKALVREQKNWVAFLKHETNEEHCTDGKLEGVAGVDVLGIGCAAKDFTSCDDPAGTELQLTVNLVGGMDVYIGERRIADAAFSRKKAKTLLALLVFNRGHEMSRERLARLLWPESNPEHARKNFYAVWSSLRGVLKKPDGSCPYLIRRQDGVQLDNQLLKTDIDDLDTVCRTLMFEQTTFGGWLRVYEQVHTRFSEDVMPGEKSCTAIIGQRNFARDRLVDALVSAARRLSNAGNCQEALWFARAALEHDNTREDAYTALMRAQLASNQRSAALSTYFKCRLYLAEELGIDPSEETMGLYQSIIGVEAAI